MGASGRCASNGVGQLRARAAKVAASCNKISFTLKNTPPKQTLFQESAFKTVVQNAKTPFFGQIWAFYPARFFFVHVTDSFLIIKAWQRFSFGLCNMDTSRFSRPQRQFKVLKPHYKASATPRPHLCAVTGLQQFNSTKFFNRETNRIPRVLQFPSIHLLNLK
jgi:hypothetical protein